MQVLKIIAKSVWRRSKLVSERLQRRFATRRLHGPAHIHLAEDQVMVVALMRDAGWFLDLFLDHHFEIGVTHVLIIDNGSIDNTLSIARSYGERVTVLQNNMQVKLHESALRSELAKRVAKSGWFLFVDSDELVELPAPIDKLINYCNNNGYTAVLGQMLDRFSELPYSEIKCLDYRSAVENMRFYSLNNVESIDYNDKVSVPFHWFLRDNSCDEPARRLKKGGVRKEIFSEEPFLSKHSLVRNISGVTPMSHPHCASGVRVADVSLLLNHFKLAGDWVARDRKTVQSATWEHGEDARRLAQVIKDDDFHISVAQKNIWRGLDALQEEGYLYVSTRFQKMLQHSKP